MKNKKIINLRKKTHHSVDKIMDAAEGMGENGREKFDNLKEKAINLEDKFEDYIKRNPKKSLLIAVGIGAVVSAFLISLIRRQ